MLEIDGIEKSFDGFELGPVDLRVGDEILAVLGPSGCGKTTLLSIVAGLIAPDAGRIELDGTALTGLPPHARGVGLVFQDGALFPHLTARENVAYAAASTAAVERLAARLEIEPVLDQPATTLSGGERQRVALARSLAADPDALLLDEPLANLDAPIKRRLRDELRDLLGALDIPVVYVTHNQNQASVVGDRIAVVAGGTIRQVGAAEEVFRRPATPFVASFTGSENVFRATVREVDGGVTLDWGPHRLRAAGATDAVEVGDRVPVSIRPEYVEIGDEGVPARVEEVRYAGHAYRVAARAEGVDARVRVIAAPARFERLDLGVGDAARLAFPPDALHVMADGE